MLETIRNAFKTKEIRNKLLFVFLGLIIVRIGCNIPLPGVNTNVIQNLFDNNQALNFLDVMTGGSFTRMSIFALNITPYITASIIVQLLTIAIPRLEELQKDGEDGRKKINEYTRYLSIVLALIEGLAIVIGFRNQGFFTESGYTSVIISVVALTAGAAFLMWLGEEITEKGIGNGISMIIFVGIISGLPSAVTMIWDLIFGTGAFSTVGLLTALAIIAGAVLLIAGVVFVQQAERRIPVQYSKKVVGRKMMGGQSTHIPLKLAMAGVMPIIFASSFMTFPAMIIQIFNSNIAEQSGFLAGLYKLSIATSTSTLTTSAGATYPLPIGYSIANALIYLLLIVGFTFFYTYATFNPAEISSNIKKNGGFIPGIRTGKSTTEYLSSVISKLTIFGGFFLALIAIIPMMARFTTVDLAFGGTSILIIVGVALETMQQLESQVVMKHYKGFLE